MKVEERHNHDLSHFQPFAQPQRAHLKAPHFLLLSNKEYRLITGIIFPLPYNFTKQA